MLCSSSHLSPNSKQWADLSIIDEDDDDDDVEDDEIRTTFPPNSFISDRKIEVFVLRRLQCVRLLGMLGRAG